MFETLLYMYILNYSRALNLHSELHGIKNLYLSFANTVLF